VRKVLIPNTGALLIPELWSLSALLEGGRQGNVVPLSLWEHALVQNELLRIFSWQKVQREHFKKSFAGMLFNQYTKK
jgi:hypothetical protein